MDANTSNPRDKSTLSRFLLAHFPPDWMLDHPDAGAVVDRYVRAAAGVDVAALIAEVNTVLGGFDTDPELPRVIAGQLAKVNLGDTGPKQWLVWLRDELVAAQTSKPPPPPYSYGSRDVQPGYESQGHSPRAEPWGRDPWADED